MNNIGSSLRFGIWETFTGQEVDLRVQSGHYQSVIRTLKFFSLISSSSSKLPYFMFENGDKTGFFLNENNDDVVYYLNENSDKTTFYLRKEDDKMRFTKKGNIELKYVKIDDYKDKRWAMDNKMYYSDKFNLLELDADKGMANLYDLDKKLDPSGNYRLGMQCSVVSVFLKEGTFNGNINIGFRPGNNIREGLMLPDGRYQDRNTAKSMYLSEFPQPFLPADIYKSKCEHDTSQINNKEFIGSSILGARDKDKGSMFMYATSREASEFIPDIDFDNLDDDSVIGKMAVSLLMEDVWYEDTDDEQLIKERQMPELGKTFVSFLLTSQDTTTGFFIFYTPTLFDSSTGEIIKLKE